MTSFGGTPKKQPTTRSQAKPRRLDAPEGEPQIRLGPRPLGSPLPPRPAPTPTLTPSAPTQVHPHTQALTDPHTQSLGSARRQSLSFGLKIKWAELGAIAIAGRPAPRTHAHTHAAKAPANANLGGVSCPPNPATPFSTQSTQGSAPHPSPCRQTAHTRTRTGPRTPHTSALHRGALSIFRHVTKGSTNGTSTKHQPNINQTSIGHQPGIKTASTKQQPDTNRTPNEHQPNTNRTTTEHQPDKPSIHRTTMTHQPAGVGHKVAANVRPDRYRAFDVTPTGAPTQQPNINATLMLH